MSLTPSRRRGAVLLLARWRRTLGACCAALAAAGIVLVLRPPTAPTVDVVVAARDLTALAPLGEGDTAVRALPGDAVPDGALRPDTALTGASLRSPVRRGEVFTDARLADPPAAGHGADVVAAPVRVADPGAAALLRPGSRIDVLAAAHDPLAAEFGGATAPAEVVAADRPVIAVPEEEAPAGESGALVLVAVSTEEARVIAAHTVSGRLSITIRG
ncbi:Flp pilus assembly protein CpaB [Spinactinospora alkalitolerans]|uniref:Flp pilus assembly protein CpaB n=1 Tax=Spinactinospora alkalitolerans TaxID=687207 RepID=A0A852TQD4_9ACTN|nr:SAF domain-containing protein [Spinactinospora alkalitolerans]NYE45497.1 Flp pilus assembly protein CpaB [Spinactinospora alkalitolerans]